MKYKAPTLSSGKRATLTRTVKWFLDLMIGLETGKARFDELSLALETAEVRKVQAEKDAALLPGAALTLAGAEAQLSRLRPEIKQCQEALDRQIVVAIRQMNIEWSEQVRLLLFGPIIEQLQASIATAISPFFSGNWAAQFARQIMERTDQYRQISFYLNRPACGATEFEDAMREINAFVDELNKILAGETLLEA